MNPKLFLLITAIVIAVIHPAEAQQAKKIPRIGYVLGTRDPDGPNVVALRQGLRDLGYVEGKNILFEYRSFDGNQNRIASVVAELIELKVDVLIAIALPSIRAAKRATKTIPIVMLATVDPVATGLVNSLARPGGNITGIARLARELGGKRLELLKEMIPKVLRVAVLRDPDPPATTIGLKEYETAARTLKIQILSLATRGPKPDLEGAFEAAIKARANAIVTIANPVLNPYTKQIVDLSIKNLLPLMCETNECVESGGLASYSANEAENFRRAAWYVDRILKGTKPADLPVEQPTKFELVINLKTAKQIGLTIPPNVLARADRVIR